MFPVRFSLTFRDKFGHFWGTFSLSKSHMPERRKAACKKQWPSLRIFWGYCFPQKTIFICLWGYFQWAASIRHLMWKPSATSSRKFGQKLSHRVMPKLLVLKAQGRHVMWWFWAFFAPKFWPEKIVSRDGCFLLISRSSENVLLNKHKRKNLARLLLFFEAIFGLARFFF